LSNANRVVKTLWEIPNSTEDRLKGLKTSGVSGDTLGNAKIKLEARCFGAFPSLSPDVLGYEKGERIRKKAARQ
jgi:hypothetical protein